MSASDREQAAALAAGREAELRMLEESTRCACRVPLLARLYLGSWLCTLCRKLR